MNIFTMAIFFSISVMNIFTMTNFFSISVMNIFTMINLQWNPSIKPTQDGGLSKEVACHDG